MVNVLVSKKFVDKCKEHSVAVQKHHKSKGTVNNSYTKYVPTKEQQNGWINFLLNYLNYWKIQTTTKNNTGAHNVWMLSIFTHKT